MFGDLGHHDRDVEQQSTDCVGGIVDRPTDPPRLRMICRVVSSPAIARVGQDLASRSSLVTTRVSPSQRLPQAGSLAVGTGQAVVDVNPLGLG